MFTRSVIVPVLLLSTGATLGSFAQERIKPKGVEDFAAVHTAVKKAYDAGHFGKAYDASKKLSGICAERRALAIREALPPAPASYELVKPKKQNAQQAALLNAMTASMGNIIEATYRGPDGQIKTTVTADSPFVQMFSMMVGNAAMLQDNQELIKYGEYMAVLEVADHRTTLQLVIDGTMVETVFPVVGEDFVFAMWDQAAVDRLAAALAN